MAPHIKGWAEVGGGEMGRGRGNAQRRGLLRGERACGGGWGSSAFPAELLAGRGGRFKTRGWPPPLHVLPGGIGGCGCFGGGLHGGEGSPSPPAHTFRKAEVTTSILRARPSWVALKACGVNRCGRGAENLWGQSMWLCGVVVDCVSGPTPMVSHTLSRLRCPDQASATLPR